MFKTMLDTQMIFYLMGVIGGIGLLGKRFQMDASESGAGCRKYVKEQSPFYEACPGKV